MSYVLLIGIGSAVACLCSFNGGKWAAVSWVAGSLYGALAAWITLA